MVTEDVKAKLRAALMAEPEAASATAWLLDLEPLPALVLCVGLTNAAIATIDDVGAVLVRRMPR